MAMSLLDTLPISNISQRQFYFLKNFSLALFALLDLFICVVLYKLTLSQGASSRFLVDKTTQKVYYLRESVRHDGRIVS